MKKDKYYVYTCLQHIPSTWAVQKKLFRLRIYCVLRSALRQSETTNYWPEIIPNSNSIVQSEEMGRASAPDEDAALLFSVHVHRDHTDY